MFTTIIQPRVGDTDFLGHINNAVLAHWFETARNPYLRFFIPDLNIKIRNFPLIIAHTDYDFVDQLFFQYEVEIRTWVTHIGNKSFTLYHEAWQKEHLCVNGSVVIVYYDFKTGKSTALPADKKKLLKSHMVGKEKSLSGK